MERLAPGTVSVPCIAVVSGEATFDQYIAEEHPLDCRDSILGAVDLLYSTHYPVDSIPDWRLSADLLRNYQAVVLPETEVLTNAQGEVLRNFVRRGGTIIASWKCGMKDEKGQKRDDFLLADVLGVSFQEEQTKYVANVNKKRLWGGASIFLEPSDHPLARSVGKELVGIAGGYIRVAGRPKRFSGCDHRCLPRTSPRESSSSGIPRPRGPRETAKVSPFPAMVKGRVSIWDWSCFVSIDAPSRFG